MFDYYMDDLPGMIEDGEEIPNEIQEALTNALNCINELYGAEPDTWFLDPDDSYFDTITVHYNGVQV